MEPTPETQVENLPSQGPEDIFPEFTNAEEVNSMLLSMPRLIGIAVDRMLFARRESNKANRELKEREAKLYNDFRFGKDRRHTKDDAQILFPTDSGWVDLKKKADLAQAKTEYYENRLRMLKETGWLLRTYVDHQRYLSGENRN